MFYLSYARNNSNQLLQHFWGKKDAVIRLKLYSVTYDTKKHLFCCNIKNKVPCQQNSHLLYQIMCLGCSGKYIGKTEIPLISHTNRRGKHHRSFSEVIFNNYVCSSNSYVVRGRTVSYSIGGLGAKKVPIQEHSV